MVSDVSTLRALDIIVHDCFYNVRFDENLQLCISDFKKSLAATGISENLKFHVRINHFQQCLEYFNEEEGLGIWSKQAGRRFLIAEPLSALAYSTVLIHNLR